MHWTDFNFFFKLFFNEYTFLFSFYLRPNMEDDDDGEVDGEDDDEKKVKIQLIF